MKRNTLIVAFLIVLALGVILSLKRSSNFEEPSGEIKHFDHAKLAETIRLKDGKTLEEYFDQHIHLSNHPKTHTGMHISFAQKEAPTPTFEEGVLLTHKVKSGETLMHLANRYHATMYQIRKRNGLLPDRGLKVGQKLQIVPGEKPTYRVRPGDNLTMIGKRFGVNHREIMRLNHLESGQAIWIGQKLIMPIAQKKIDGVLSAIARKKQEEIQRKKRYERELLSRLARQKLARQRQAKARAEKAAKAKKAKAAKEKLARLERAKQAFKYTGTNKFRHKIRVVATAYTSHRGQTDSTPFLAAWNNRIRPGMKIIAVSPDLIRKYGITNGVRVKIAGLPGTYVVRDKMNKRLHDHIDIYMGVNRRRALRWGRRRVVMYW